MTGGSYRSIITPTQGFHPSFKTTVDLEEPPGPAACSLYLVHVLPPKEFILDRYQLKTLREEGRLGPGFEIASALLPVRDSQIQSIGQGLWLWGDLDLEKPSFSVDRNQSEVGLMLRLSTELDEMEVQMEMAIPLHLRYLEPVQERWRLQGGKWARNDLVEISVDWPVVFWACAGGPGCPASSLSRITSQPISSLLPFPDSRIRYLSPNGSSPFQCENDLELPKLSIVVPTGVKSDLRLVQIGQFLAIWTAFGIVVWRVWRTSRAAPKRKIE